MTNCTTKLHYKLNTNLDSFYLLQNSLATRRSNTDCLLLISTKTAIVAGGVCMS
jgi:hypothetical protein